MQPALDDVITTRKANRTALRHISNQKQATVSDVIVVSSVTTTTAAAAAAASAGQPVSD